MEMRNAGNAESSLSIGDQASTPSVIVNDGTYEASYNALKVFMDDTQWGMKKRARFTFTITRGQFKGVKVYFRGSFLKNEETGEYFIGSKSALADTIRIITGGGKTIDKTHVGTKVFVVVKTKEKKKLAEGETVPGKYCFVDSVIAAPDTGEAEVAPVAAAKPIAAAMKAPASKASIIEDLSTLSDFND